MTSSGGIDDEFEVLGGGEGDSDEGAADEEGMMSSGASDGEVRVEDVIGAEGAVGSLCCDDGPDGDVLFELATDTVFCDPFFDFFAFARTGEERCNCRTATLGSIGVDLTSEKTIRLAVFRE